MAILYHHIEPDIYLDYGITQNPDLSDHISFIKGTIINEHIPEPLVFEVNIPTDVGIPHFLGDYIPVFSDLLVKTLKAGGADNFQAFPAVLKNPETGFKWAGFWAVNIIGLIAAVNPDLSEGDTLVEADPDGADVSLTAFSEIVLDKTKTHDILMFRLAESPGTLIIHHSIDEYIDANRPPGGWNFMSTDIETV